MNVVFDTGVLVAAFTTRGTCATLFEITLNRHRLFLSPHLLKESIHAFQTIVHLPQKHIRDLLRYVREVGSIVEPVPLGRRTCPHRPDDRILALAGHVRADCLVTADLDLLSLKTYRSVRIVDPRRFWEINLLKQSGPVPDFRARAPKRKGGELSMATSCCGTAKKAVKKAKKTTKKKAAKKSR
jgi:putative PIN family toxin of toxin-antitoxin system